MEKAALAQQVLELEKTQQLLADKEVEFIRLNSKSEAVLQELDEQQKFFKQVMAILEENTSFSLHYVEKEILDELCRQKESETLRLKEESAQLQICYNTIQDKDLEIPRLHNLVSDLQTHMNQITEKDKEIINLTQNFEHLNDKFKQLDQKEAKIIRLQAAMDEYKKALTNNERELYNLQKQLTDTNLVVENQKQQLQDYNALQSTFDERNHQISTLFYCIVDLQTNII
ncbi:unnamed protein product [Diabrotica balteata]|uniref:Uncharacterized protein n=1 Tax=Diabrotica balteata TaxID=107213 RepID=A0A9N9XGY2_DIABA|nr:unnamed protein product [Diabrotica balteata]